MNKTVDFRADVLSFSQLILQFFSLFVQCTNMSLQYRYCRHSLVYYIMLTRICVDWLLYILPLVSAWLSYICVFKDGCKTSHHRMKYIRSSCIVNSIIAAPACICMNHECISIVCATAIDRDYRVCSYIYYIPIANIKYII